MDRTTASYKMKHGVAKTMEENMIEQLQACPFSLNADESTNNTNKHILSILVSYFDEESGLVAEHLLSLDVIKCDASNVFQSIVDIIGKK